MKKTGTVEGELTGNNVPEGTINIVDLEQLGSEEVGSPVTVTAPAPEKPREVLAGYIKDGVVFWDIYEKALCVCCFTGLKTDGNPSHMTIPLTKIGCFSASVVAEANRKNDPLADTRKRLKRLAKSGVSPEMLQLALKELEGDNGTN